MAGDYRVDTLALPETLRLVHELLDRVRADHPDLAPSDLMLFETAVTEIATNVVEHGSAPGTVQYSFTLEVRTDRLLGRLRDAGSALPEAERRCPTPTARAGGGWPSPGSPRRPRLPAGRRPQRVDDGRRRR